MARRGVPLQLVYLRLSVVSTLRFFMYCGISLMQNLAQLVDIKSTLLRVGHPSVQIQCIKKTFLCLLHQRDYK